MTHADAGDFAAALTAFEQALAARERIGDPETIRVARWMIAWSLRNLGRRQEALEIQRSLKEELDAIGGVDAYVDDERAAGGLTPPVSPGDAIRRPEADAGGGRSTVSAWNGGEP